MLYYTKIELQINSKNYKKRERVLNMKDKSLFKQILALIIIAVICVLLTVGTSLLAGSLNAELFDFRNLNFSNMLPVLIVGVFISCAVVGICVLFVLRTAFVKAKDYLKENDKENGGKEK